MEGWKGAALEGERKTPHETYPPSNEGKEKKRDPAGARSRTGRGKGGKEKKEGAITTAITNSGKKLFSKRKKERERANKWKNRRGGRGKL